MKTPADLYRPSPRRPGRVIIGGFPDGAVPCNVSRQGTANYHGKRVYVSMAVAGYQVAFEHCADIIRVWFHDQLLGAIDAQAFEARTDVSVEPIEAVRAAALPPPKSRRGNPNLRRAAEERRLRALTAIVSPGDGVTCGLPAGNMSPASEVPTLEIQQRVSPEVEG